MADSKLSGKTVLVTGASRGIGRAIALLLAERGARLTLAARTVEALAAMAAEARRLGAETLEIASDLADPAAPARMVAAAAARFGGLDVLVNNAGLAHAASKHALMGFTKALAQEVHALGIREHAVLPGGVATDMVTRMRPDLDTSGLIAPEEVARAVLFLLEQDGNAVIDEIDLRRAGKAPWN